MSDQYAVIGNPIVHSLSPRIHNLFAVQTKQDISYTAKRVPADALENTLEQLQEQGFKGLSVTLPLKADAYNLMDYHSDRAHIAECINTIKFDNDGRRFGDNTDGAGLCNDLENNLNLTLADKKILLLGAGGAVRNCVWPLLEKKPSNIVIANRTLSKAEDLCEQLDSLHLKACALDNMPQEPFDIIINCTSASLNGETLPVTKAMFDKSTAYYDLVYGEKVAPILAHIKKLGIKHVHDGLGMLVEQAALQFKLWRGVLPETAPLITTLRS